jgi:hypothetical protein
MSLNTLFQNFSAVPHEYSLRPFWFWNGALTPAEVQRQIEAMAAQGIWGAHVHNRSGLQPRYLSDGWWELVSAALEKSAEIGFAFCMVDEYNWPSGEARDFTQPDVPSRVLAANPEFQMRSLMPEMRSVRGGTVAQFTPIGKFDIVVAAQRAADGHIDPNSLQAITADVRMEAKWNVPDGCWDIFTFRLQRTIGMDGGNVDLLNPDAVRAFLDAVYEQYQARVGQHFGGAFQATYIDHEGDYGWQLAWTPKLFRQFRQIKGYDLAPMLPLLLEDGGARTPVVRCDYFDVIATLYADSFFKQISDWCREHHIHTSGHVWEESLQAQTAFQGDHFRIQRALETPGVDSLFEWGRYPRHFKEAASVAHFRETAFTVENQGVQGIDNFLSLERIKRTTNMLALWGTTMFIPHAINGNPDRIDFPEDWFERQPWWKYTQHYADYAARLSYMNSGGRHVCDLLLYYPIETAWAHGDVCFDAKKWTPGFEGIDTGRGQFPPVWNNPVDEINQVYGDIIDTLPEHRWDLDIADAHYLNEARIADGRLHIASESFGVLILPPMTCIRREAAAKARAFAEAGGIVIALGFLPFDSMESGRGDPELRAEWESLFGAEIVTRASSSRLNHGFMQHGRAFWAADVPALLNLLEAHVTRDVRVLRGDGKHLFALHRIKDDAHVYWLVNDTDTPKSIVIDVPVVGRTVLLHPEDGTQRDLFYTHADGRTELHLWFEGWEAYYILIDPSARAEGAPVRVLESNLREYRADDTTLRGVTAANGTAYATVEGRKATAELRADILHLPEVLIGGDWRCHPLLAMTPIAHAKMRSAKPGEGEALGWHTAAYNDSFWAQEWLSAERHNIRDWHVLGAFDYHFHLGYNEVMPPEQGIDLDAEYEGRHGKRIRWQRYTSPVRVINLDDALHTPKAERSSAIRFVSAFALTYIYSPDDRSAEIRCTADSNAKIWLNDALMWAERDDHHGYMEMRDAFGARIPVQLRAGWNRLLLKISQGQRFAGIFGFTCRVCDADGQAFTDLRFSADAADVTPSEPRERWYRLPIPPGATAVEPLARPISVAWWADGQQLAPSTDGAVDLPPNAKTLALRIDDGDHLPDFVHIRTGSFDAPLGSLTHTGLSYYVGQIVYDKQFTLPPAYLGCTLILDLGTVGTTAEVWLNGTRIGERVWQPFAFNITPYVREGTNDLRVIVANTASNDRARGDTERQMWGVLVRGAELLDALEENGLLGPVRVLPWVEVALPIT